MDAIYSIYLAVVIRRRSCPLTGGVRWPGRSKQSFVSIGAGSDTHPLQSLAPKLAPFTRYQEICAVGNPRDIHFRPRC